MPSAPQYNAPVASVFPVSPAIPTRSFNTQRFNQIVRIAFQVFGTPFSTQANLKLKSNWDTLIAATDATRIVLSPPFSNSKITPSKALQTNPDSNATYRGEPVYFGEGTSMFSADFLDVDAAVIDAFFNVVSGISFGGNGATSGSLVGYWCNNDGHLFSNPTWGGLPAINLAARTRGGNGLNSSDITGFDFYLPPNWDGGTNLPTPTPFGAGVVDLRTYAW